MKTALNNVLLPTLFQVVNNTEQVDEPELACNQKQQCWTILLTTWNNVSSKTLFNAVFIRPEQVVRFLLCTQQKSHNLFWPDENSIEQCFAAHIVQGTILFNIVTPDCRLIQAQQYRTILLTTYNNVGSTTLFNVVFIRPEQVVRFLLCIRIASLWSAVIIRHYSC